MGYIKKVKMAHSIYSKRCHLSTIYWSYME